MLRFGIAFWSWQHSLVSGPLFVYAARLVFSILVSRSFICWRSACGEGRGVELQTGGSVEGFCQELPASLNKIEILRTVE